MKKLATWLTLALGVGCLGGCATTAEASPAQTLRGFVLTTEGGTSGGPIRVRQLERETGSLGESQVAEPSQLFFGDLVAHPKKPWIFATEGNQRVYSFRLDPKSGKLLEMDSLALSTRLVAGDQLLLTPSGQLLLLCQQDQLTAMEVLADGTLLARTAWKIPGGGHLSHGVVDRSGQLAYVVDSQQGYIWGLRIEGTNLTGVSPQPVASLPGSNLRKLVVDESNRFLFGLDDNADLLCGYTLGDNGTLASNGSKSLGSAADQHTDMVIRERRLWVCEQGGQRLKVFDFDESGTLSPVGNFGGGGARLSLAKGWPYLVVANHSGQPDLKSLDAQALKSFDQQQTPKAVLDLEAVVFNSNLK